jgi:hypothetical protein
MNTDRNFPITRSPLFMDENTFKLFEEIGQDYCETWLGQKIVLYSINRFATNVDDLYGETKPNQIKYSTPVELPCRYEIKESTNESYLKQSGNARYKQSGNIEVNLYDKTLKEYNCDIKYGDLMGVVIDPKTIFYYEVMDDGKRNFANSQTMWGYTRLWRTVKGVEIDENVFNG